MSEAERPPYRAAAIVGALVLAVFVATLAPTVTFWDAGEFIAAARTLGIPHPPGTPLFVLIAHVWALLVPVGEYAYRTNLLSACCSSAAAALLFLVVHHSMRGVVAGLPDDAARLLRTGGAAAAAMLGAFSFTNWQNSNETEVYTVATLTTAAMAWAAILWRSRRGTERAPRFLLLIIYLAGMSIGNHLLSLLAVPGVLLFLVATLRDEPAPDPGRRREEWGQVAVVAGVWALLVGTGLGSASLTVVGAACFLAAAVFAASGGAGAFALLALGIAAVGITPYAFVYLRSAQHPMINEADPSTFDSLLAVIRRAQYPPRTPLDDPTEISGPDNPGRTLSLIYWQLINYFQYFDWQWARALGDVARKPVTILFVTLGLRGLWEQRRSDRATWWMLLGIFLVTGLGLVFYMNFKPGFSLALEQWPNLDDHEVRERDYFFVVSFIVWGLWAGIGLAAFAADAVRAIPRARLVAPALLLVALVPVALNWSKASRRHGPDARLAADFAYDLLNTAPPYGILFTFGDNDTFPLWWAQEVAGIRQDVTVVCLALANTDWYMRQLRENPVRPVDPAQIPKLWRDSIPPAPTWKAAYDDRLDDRVGHAGVLRAAGAGGEARPPGPQDRRRIVPLSQRDPDSEPGAEQRGPAADRLVGHVRHRCRRPARVRGPARARLSSSGDTAGHHQSQSRPPPARGSAAGRPRHRDPGVRDLPLRRPARARGGRPRPHLRQRRGESRAAADPVGLRPPNHRGPRADGARDAGGRQDLPQSPAPAGPRGASGRASRHREIGVPPLSLRRIVSWPSFKGRVHLKPSHVLRCTRTAVLATRCMFL